MQLIGFAEEGKRNNKGAKILGRTPIRHPGEGGLGPGGSSAMPSFALENIRAGKGVVFGHKLKTRFEIDEALGHFAGPAPGGNTKVPSFVRESASPRHSPSVVRSTLTQRRRCRPGAEQGRAAGHPPRDAAHHCAPPRVPDRACARRRRPARRPGGEEQAREARRAAALQGQDLGGDRRACVDPLPACHAMLLRANAC